MKTFFIACNREYSNVQELNLKQFLFEILYECADDAAMSLFELLLKFAGNTYFRFRRDGKENIYNFPNSSFKSFFIWQIKFAHEFFHLLENKSEKSQIVNIVNTIINNRTTGKFTFFVFFHSKTNFLNSYFGQK